MKLCNDASPYDMCYYNEWWECKNKKCGKAQALTIETPAYTKRRKGQHHE